MGMELVHIRADDPEEIVNHVRLHASETYNRSIDGPLVRERIRAA